jgi:hypothetical protein
MKKRHDKTDRLDLESPLGLADEPIVTTPSDHLESDPSSNPRSRARALGEDGIERQSTGIGDLTGDEHDGATSIDMGSGGDGTDIKRSR